ncbi:MAG: alpha-L-fucosidase [Halanaerobiaceae bacterium]
MANNDNLMDLSGAELASKLKSSVNFKGLDGVKGPQGMRQPAEKMAWWHDAKFGMFIHWGLYSLLARGEWVMYNENISVEEYAKLADKFSAEEFNAGRWAGLAKEAGMKYMVLTARHHDGFSLWDSPGSFWNFTSMNSAAGKDFVEEYIKACRKADLNVGLYYSLMDWRFPGYFKPQKLAANAALMKKQCYEQIEELMSKYGKVDILWYDGAWLNHEGGDAAASWFWEPVKLNQMARSYNPDLLINPRSGWEGDFNCDEGGHEVTGEIIEKPWEKNFSIGEAWGYVKNSSVWSYQDIIHMLINVFVRNGNVLLNVTPDARGIIPAEQQKRLKEVGEFMKRNGEAIYGTRGGPLQPVDGVYGTTYKEDKIYLHILNKDKFEDQILPSVDQKIESCSILNDQQIEFEQSSAGIRVSIPEDIKSTDILILKFELADLVEESD